MGLSNYLPTSAIAKPGVCTSSTRPASPYDGQVIYETDTDKTLVWNGSAWLEVSSVTAKGDIQTFSTVPTKLGVGTNNFTLVADSTTATGLKWATNPVVCTSSSRPASPYNGMFIYETDTGITLQYRTSSWVLPWEQRFARTTLANSTTTQMEITGIPQYGNTLHFRGMVRTMRSYSTNNGVRFRFNNISNASDYYLGTGGGQYQASFGYLGQMPNPGAIAGEFGCFEAYVPDYATNTNSGGRKFCNVFGGSYAGGQQLVSHLIGLSTGLGAVTSIQIMDDVLGAMYIGSYFEVWIGP